MRRVGIYLCIFYVFASLQTEAQRLLVAGNPGELTIRSVSANCLRITIKPDAFKEDFPATPAVALQKNVPPFIKMNRIDQSIRKKAGHLLVTVSQKPLTIAISNEAGRLIQHFILNDNGTISFKINDELILGLGEGGSKPSPGVNWRTLPVEYDRRGRYDSMQPRWQSDAYGSRNPVPMVIGTSGWATFVVSPWVQVDLGNKDYGIFIPWKPSGKDTVLLTEENQWASTAKGLPPIDKIIPGVYDLFVFDAASPQNLMKDFSTVTGPASMPPKWALGYMQSHRRLEDDRQMMGVIDTFRNKKIPIDAVIYLGTGFTPKGWNKKQPSFEFNPEVFKKDPAAVMSDMHSRNVKVVVHMVPWNRDRLPSLHGNIPPRPGEVINTSHIQQYWKEHLPLIEAGVDAFWPDEGDWFNLYERIKRHQLYYQGHLSYNPNIRPWSLQRNGFPGIAQWGGWVWSGDTESSWKTLEAQIAVGLNYSLSIGPYWGTDIGGFFPNEELTGELYARWFQFGAFCGSFRSHGQTWRTRLPWGWGGEDMSPKESRTNPLQSEMNNKAIEPVVKKYDELRYQLMPYTYTLAWEARNSGMPLMRAMWLHYPKDKNAVKTGDQFLWGRDLLIAPVYEKGATGKKVYLPEGDWYDWWNNTKQKGGQTIVKPVDLATMPIYVRAGAIIPVDTVRQFTSEVITAPTTLRIYSGANGAFTLYEDDGISMGYLNNQYSQTRLIWDDAKRKLTIQASSQNKSGGSRRVFRLQLIPQMIIKEVTFNGNKLETIL